MAEPPHVALNPRHYQEFAEDTSIRREVVMERNRPPPAERAYGSSRVELEVQRPSQREESPEFESYDASLDEGVVGMRGGAGTLAPTSPAKYEHFVIFILSTIYLLIS